MADPGWTLTSVLDKIPTMTIWTGSLWHVKTVPIEQIISYEDVVNIGGLGPSYSLTGFSWHQIAKSPWAGAYRILSNFNKRWGIAADETIVFIEHNKIVQALHWPVAGQRIKNLH